ncbi:MAG TPA: methyltransferase domain-containing protein [Candidatus Kapabacteria bacterium]|nr:methyltransferase domain-containing protein [Candidatus Kapabacteria bacterium]
MREGHGEQPRKVIVEIGTGGIPYFIKGERKRSPDEMYIATDKDDTAIEMNKAYQVGYGTDFESVKAEAEHLPYKDTSVDELIYTNVFSLIGYQNIDTQYQTKHVDVMAMLREAHRVLKDHGCVRITETLTPKDFYLLFDEEGEVDSVDDIRSELAQIGFTVESFTEDAAAVKQYDALEEDHNINERFHLVLKKVPT